MVLHALEDMRGDLFDGLVRGVEHRDPEALVHLTRLPNVRLAALQGGVGTSGAALLANALEALGVDGQGKGLVTDRPDLRGDVAALEVLLGDRVVGRAQPIVHGQIQTGWGLAGARDPQQDNIGVGEIVRAHPVVVAHGEVDGVDALGVGTGLDDGVTAPGLEARGHTQLRAQGVDEALEQLLVVTVAAAQDVADLVVEQGCEDDGAFPITVCGLLHTLREGLGTLRGVDVGHVDLLEVHAVELGQQAVTEGLGGDAGALGDEEDGAFHAGSAGVSPASGWLPSETRKALRFMSGSGLMGPGHSPGDAAVYTPAAGQTAPQNDRGDPCQCAHRVSPA